MKNSDEIVMLNGPPCILNELNLKIKGHTSRRTFDGYSKKDFKLEHATYLTYSIPLLGRRDSEKSSFKAEGTAGACSGASTSDQPGKTKLNLKCPSKKLSQSSKTGSGPHLDIASTSNNIIQIYFHNRVNSPFQKGCEGCARKFE
uniref:Uncharacterized protein n=1 Tax=Vespula pensylvanica TaxID=30213 RepID=A0A834UA49_VESPE|nr:hypothetical protein H0235_008017 [Vespula pensylvanica]